MQTKRDLHAQMIFSSQLYVSSDVEIDDTNDNYIKLSIVYL